MKIVVIGAGQMGSVIASDLTRYHEITDILVIDASLDQLNRVRNCIKDVRVGILTIDVLNAAALRNILSQFDVGVIALPNRRLSYSCIEAAIESRLDVVDILEEFHRRPDEYETEGLFTPDGMSLAEYGEVLHTRAIENDVTILDGMGFAPGLTNVTLEHGIRSLNLANSAIARVGSIPNKACSTDNPLGYFVTWQFEHVLREYMIDAKVRRQGQVVEVPAMSDLQEFTFSEFDIDEQLECAVTPGMPSFVFSRPSLQDFAEMTIRWPGHWKAMRLFRDCGFLDTSPISMVDHSVIPRQFVARILQDTLKPKDPYSDVAVMWNTVEGIQDGQKCRIDYYVWEPADKQAGVSAIARATAYPAAAGAVLLGRGAIEATGILPPEDAIVGMSYDFLISELERRNFTILEKRTELPLT